MIKDQKSTKQRILDVGLDLFSQKGFKGTSIREISKAADVNVSAVSYYFSSKEQLYIDIILDSKQFLKDKFTSLYKSKDNWSSTDFVKALTDVCYEHSDRISATFKIFINSKNLSSDIIISDSNTAGPPGVEFIQKILIKEFPDIEVEEAFEIAYMTQSYVIHKAVIANTLKQTDMEHTNKYLQCDFGRDYSTCIIELYKKLVTKK